VTLADHIEAVLVDRGPLPVCEIAPAVRKQKALVIATLTAHPDRFAHNGQGARASRWDVRAVRVADLVERWTRLELVSDPDGRISEYQAGAFVAYWLERGLLESADGNGRLRVTELGADLSRVLHEGGG
jgi:hypothetical protein